MKSNCRCGQILDSEKGEELKSFFHKESGMRLTVCDKCAKEYNLTDEKNYYTIDYKKINESQNKTPQPK